MRKNDANPDHADLAARPHKVDDLLAQKEARIAQLGQDLVAAKEAKSAVADRLSRQFDDVMAVKNGQIGECLYHLNRMNASPWWRLGKWLERIALRAHPPLFGARAKFGCRITRAHGRL